MMFSCQIIVRKAANIGDLPTRGYILQIPVSKSSHNILIKCDVILLVVWWYENKEVAAG